MMRPWTISFALAGILSILLISSARGNCEAGYEALERADYEHALHHFSLCAEAADPDAQHNLGVMHTFGLGVPPDDAEAVLWYRRAAEQGHVAAQSNLGLMYAEGRGVEQDDAEAARWYRLAADQGFAEAQKNLGVKYARGQGVPRDESEAVRWFRLAADQGLAAAQNSLGAMLADGRGVAQDDAEAMHWYRLAADQGDAHAAFNLGLMYADGRGVAQDDVEAVRWFRLAADQGLATAQHNLGWMHVIGAGVPQDDVLAYMWLNLAAARWPQGNERRRTVELRDEVAARLSPAERVRGQELARNWQPGVAARSEGESPDRWWEEAPMVADEHRDAPLQRRIQSTGTGFAVSRDGHLLTNHHVVADCTEVRVQPPSESDESDEYFGLLVWAPAVAMIVASDLNNDLALLRAPVRLPVPIAVDDRGIRPGDTVVAVGFPLPDLLASEASVTTGTVSALAGIGNDTRLLQVTVPVQPGNSGGPLLDLQGRVVGVVVGKLDALQVASITGDIPQNVNFAIKAGVARSFLAASGVMYESDEVVLGDGGAHEPESSMELRPATVGAQAKAFTVLLECWK